MIELIRNNADNRLTFHSNENNIFKSHTNLWRASGIHFFITLKVKTLIAWAITARNAPQ